MGLTKFSWGRMPSREKGGILFLIIFTGLPYIGNIDYFEMPYGLKGVFEGSALVFFAYIGFEKIVKLSEETKTPGSTIPRGLLLAKLISIVIYILVAISAVSIMGWERVGKSEATVADLASLALGKKAFLLMSVIALFATANTVLLVLLGVSRIIYGMADSFSLPNILARVHPSRGTPWVAILTGMVLSVLFVSVGDITFVANVTNFILFITFFLINSAVISLRYKEPEARRPFRVPLTISTLPVLPLIGLIFCIFMLSQLEVQVLVLGTALVLSGALFSLVKKQRGILKTEGEIE